MKKTSNNFTALLTYDIHTIFLWVYSILQWLIWINIKWCYVKYSNRFMSFNCLIVYAYLWLRFPDMKTNTGPRPPVPGVCRILCCTVRSLSENIFDLTNSGFVSALYTVMLWDFGIRYASRVVVDCSCIWSPCPVVPGQDALDPSDGCICARWIWSISPTQIWVWLLQNVVL